MINDKLDILLSAAIGSNNFTNTPLSKDELTTLINSDYSEAYNKIHNGFCIYRGERSTLPIYSICTPGLRKSQNTYNVYNRLFSDILPSWENYPPRNRSFVCTSNYERTKGYVYHNSNIYILLPKNGAKIGICPTADIWRAFDKSKLYQYSLDAFNTEFLSMINDLNIFHYIMQNLPLINLSDRNFIVSKKDKIIKEISKLDAYFVDIHKNKIEYDKQYILYSLVTNELFLKLFDLSMKQPSILLCIDEILNPNTNKFKVKTISQYNINSNENYELWTDSPCIFIRESYFK